MKIISHLYGQSRNGWTLRPNKLGQPNTMAVFHKPERGVKYAVDDQRYITIKEVWGVSGEGFNWNPFRLKDLAGLHIRDDNDFEYFLSYKTTIERLELIRFDGFHPGVWVDEYRDFDVTKEALSKYTFLDGTSIFPSRAYAELEWHSWTNPQCAKHRQWKNDDGDFCTCYYCQHRKMLVFGFSDGSSYIYDNLEDAIADGFRPRPADTTDNEKHENES